MEPFEFYNPLKSENSKSIERNSTFSLKFYDKEIIESKIEYKEGS